MALLTSTRYRRALDARRRELLIDALQKKRGDIDETAKYLGLSRGHVYILANQFDIDTKSFKVNDVTDSTL